MPAGRSISPIETCSRPMRNSFARRPPTADRPRPHKPGQPALLRLMREGSGARPEATTRRRAYVIGWPVSETADLPALPFPACSAPDEPACILSWQSFAEPADPSQVTDAYDADPARAGSAILCTNPLTGTRGGSAGPERNLGTLLPNEDFSGAELRRGAVPARCGPRASYHRDSEAAARNGPLRTSGHNYHVYDYPVWANTGPVPSDGWRLSKASMTPTNRRFPRRAAPAGAARSRRGTKICTLSATCSGWTSPRRRTDQRGKFAKTWRSQTLIGQRCVIHRRRSPTHLDGSEQPAHPVGPTFAPNLAPLGLPILSWSAGRPSVPAPGSRPSQPRRRAELIDNGRPTSPGAIDALTRGPVAGGYPRSRGWPRSRAASPMPRTGGRHDRSFRSSSLAAHRPRQLPLGHRRRACDRARANGDRRRLVAEGSRWRVYERTRSSPLLLRKPRFLAPFVAGFGSAESCPDRLG